MNSEGTINHDFLFNTCHGLHFIYDSLVINCSNFVSTMIERPQQKHYSETKISSGINFIKASVNYEYHVRDW